MKKYPGVFTAKKKNGSIYYRSSITFRAKHISLGSYDTPQEAHRAYLEASLLITSDQVFSPMDYRQYGKVLPFSKWIVLCNFKNNGIYIKTPIYLRNKFFQYYLSQHDILLFDIDDLFYYSHHSIMRRGSHLFVADYGMQVNIASRYGIRNFAVKDRDFRFVNSDDHDWRYANIQVINPYYGVFQKNDGIKHYYETRIHVVGDLIVGRYDTLTQAAIAYNKAVDILQSQGITKNYPQNFIDGLAPSEYATIYTDVEISPHIAHYKA